MIATIVFAASSLLAGAASLFAKGAWTRAVAYSFLVVATSYALWFTAGEPRPVWFGTPVGTVVSYSLAEKQAIYLWVVPDGTDHPIAFAFPWSEEKAQDIMDRIEEARKKGGTVRVGDTDKNNGSKGGNGPAGGQSIFGVRVDPPLPQKGNR